MQFDRLPYIQVGTVLAAALSTIYPFFSGNWRFAHITIPLFAMLGFFIARHVLRKYQLPFGATFGDMRKAVESRQDSAK
jgi:hypothetical protein